MKIFLSTFFTLMSIIAFTQDHPSCDGSRFLEDIFTDVDSTENISFGIGTTIGGNEQELFMTIFEPQGDTAIKRPTIIVAFGGSFIGGEKEDVNFLCKSYARKGFVAVTIDYRLYDLPLFPIPTEEEMKVVVTKAVADMKGAVRFLRADADTNNTFRIDPDYIFLGGVSAGGIAAMHAAVLDETDNFPQDLTDIIAAEGGLEGTVNNLNYSSEVQGTVNFSGGLNDARWIDANDPPFISVHDDGDMTVPYNGGFANIFGFDIIYLEGSGECNRVADSVGVKNYLETFVNSNGHVSYFFDEDTESEMIDLTSAFLHDILCEDDVLSSEDINHDLNNIIIYPNPSTGLLNIDHNLKSDYLVTIYSLTGKQLLHSDLKNQLDISQLQSGFYWIEFSNPDASNKITRKLIKE